MLSGLRLAPASALACALACTAPDGSDAGDADTTAAESTSEPAQTAPATDPATTGDAPVTSAGPGTGEDSGDATTGDATTDDATTDDPTTGGGEPVQPTLLPTPTGVCPELVDGDVEFAPAGIAPRKVRLWLSDAAAEQDGPLVFYWHGTGSQPQEATYGLGASYVDQVVAQGGIIAAPHHDPEAGQFPWFLVLGSREDDLILADEVLACAIEQLGVDTTHVHTAGMSAGGLQTAQMSFRRSGYVASAAPYSGGFISTPPDQDPSNPTSAMIFHGGPDDVVVISFQMASENYLSAIEDKGGFGFLCDHGMGHSIPQGAAQESVWRFFHDHPFGATPSPYAGGLPGGFPDYCAL